MSFIFRQSMSIINFLLDPPTHPRAQVKSKRIKNTQLKVLTTISDFEI